MIELAEVGYMDGRFENRMVDVKKRMDEQLGPGWLFVSVWHGIGLWKIVNVGGGLVLMFPHGAACKEGRSGGSAVSLQGDRYGSGSE